MTWEVSTDNTTQVLTFKIRDEPPIRHRPHGWPEDIERFFQPEYGVLEAVNGEKRHLKIVGPMILKGGRLSEHQNGVARFVCCEMDKRYTDPAPEWVRNLWSGAEIRS